MATEAKIIADSIHGEHRLTTMQLKFPRFILAEFNTHRQFSRNASSSRAIPTKKIMETVRNDPAEPVYWGRNQPGMQAEEELSLEEIGYAQGTWHAARREALVYANYLVGQGVHKQIVNRILEPWMWAHVVVTATEWENFYALRTDKAAQPEMRALALAMLAVHNASEPVVRDEFEWHLPYVNNDEKNILGLENALKCSVARCARVSYLNHDGTKPDPGKDLELHDRLKTSGHVSPFEHQARPFSGDGSDAEANFRGWVQYRWMIPNENRSFTGLARWGIGRSR